MKYPLQPEATVARAKHIPALSPSRDPGEYLTQRGVAVGVGRTGDRNHRGKSA